jgi:hypothetical protein
LPTFEPCDGFRYGVDLLGVEVCCGDDHLLIFLFVI